jgi:hypothetical protein
MRIASSSLIKDPPMGQLESIRENGLARLAIEAE